MLSVLLLASAVLLYWIWQQYQQFPHTILVPAPAREQLIIISPGSSYTGMVRQLQSTMHIPEIWLWRLHGRLHAPLIRAGEYWLEPGITVAGWLDILQKGEVVQHALTVVEGWTSAEIIALLAQQELLDTTILQQAGEPLPAVLHQRLLELNATPLLQAAAQTRQQNQLDERALLEGMLLPETYHYQRGESALTVLQRMHETLLAVTMNSWQAYLQRYPDTQARVLQSPYQLLILASIIEKETAVGSERRTIAGVFHRRLQRGMLLQTDPTVIYGIGSDYDGNIRRRDLTSDSAYNTYTRKGLPPAPIANPGAAAIMATGDPEPGTALYFVASGDGGHVFSDNLQQHQQAVQRYLRTLRQKNN